MSLEELKKLLETVDDYTLKAMFESLNKDDLTNNEYEERRAIYEEIKKRGIEIGVKK